MEKHAATGQLRARILQAVSEEERRRAKSYLAFALGGAVLSAVGIGLSAWYLLQAVGRSGFYGYLSLLFSDWDVVAAHWRDFAFSLLEALPLFALTLTVIALWGFLAAARAWAKSSVRARRLTYGN